VPAADLDDAVGGAAREQRCIRALRAVRAIGHHVVHLHDGAVCQGRAE